MSAPNGSLCDCYGCGMPASDSDDRGLYACQRHHEGGWFESKDAAEILQKPDVQRRIKMMSAVKAGG